MSRLNPVLPLCGIEMNVFVRITYSRNYSVLLLLFDKNTRKIPLTFPFTMTFWKYFRLEDFYFSRYFMCNHCKG